MQYSTYINKKSLFLTFVVVIAPAVTALQFIVFKAPRRASAGLQVRTDERSANSIVHIQMCRYYLDHNDVSTRMLSKQCTLQQTSVYFDKQSRQNKKAPL